ncbi:hypothetical protein [Microbacterium lacus]|uniref:hypothetical protein n=1 Tax=Microbacterium lacus TaxID=415217 RepID=UPI000C2C4035|nr:hypothetical protein [Microbacterium lacus]
MSDEVKETIAEFERAAIATGEWRGTVVEFSDDLTVWVPFMVLTEDVTHPKYARATVCRKGVKIDTVVTIGWDESVPDAATEEGMFWLSRWLKAPHALFGAAAVRAALRRAFRDVIQDRQVAEESTWVSPVDSSPAPAAKEPATDYAALIRDAKTAEDVNTIMGWAKESGDFTDVIRTVGLTRVGVLAREAKAAT